MARSALDGTLVDCAALPYIPCIDQSTVAVESDSLVREERYPQVEIIDRRVEDECLTKRSDARLSDTVVLRAMDGHAIAGSRAFDGTFDIPRDQAW